MYTLRYGPVQHIVNFFRFAQVGVARAILWLRHVLIQKRDVKSNISDTCATQMAAPRVNYTMCIPSIQHIYLQCLLDTLDLCRSRFNVDMQIDRQTHTCAHKLTTLPLLRIRRQLIMTVA